MSAFWTNVKKMLPYKNLEIKDLAFRAGVSYSTIINGMNKNSMPHADLALKISKILNMSLECLLGTDDISIESDSDELCSQAALKEKELALYRKHKLLIDAIESLPLAVRDSMQDLIIKTSNSYH
ncbi:MAG: helix-turn-helix transcriptional regulator [Spirochaetaceae bacterium]|nr:helix-turn-helix transcriptional regulator [Spirochaetaceae bacterium]